MATKLPTHNLSIAKATPTAECHLPVCQATHRRRSTAHWLRWAISRNWAYQARRHAPFQFTINFARWEHQHNNSNKGNSFLNATNKFEEKCFKSSKRKGCTLFVAYNAQSEQIRKIANILFMQRNGSEEVLPQLTGTKKRQHIYLCSDIICGSGATQGQSTSFTDALPLFCGGRDWRGGCAWRWRWRRLSLNDCKWLQDNSLYFLCRQANYLCCCFLLFLVIWLRTLPNARKLSGIHTHPQCNE